MPSKAAAENPRTRKLIMGELNDAIDHQYGASLRKKYLSRRVNGILKQEFLVNRCPTFNGMETLVAQSIEGYNHLRPHLCLGMKTPEEVHKKTSCETQLASLKPVDVF